ncbi:hypothetical protein [Pseudomonas fluorescens]|uniref:Uncharacterized protein n=1 Tax=Pseudomonas fluorescens TaxID=294 RepID=A0A5E7EAV1_PSEFL|nr:hypothetical protein [Pseudomonas fluorescens]VVO24010.1 hypothetical protein PS710_04473 [Pseudomonas fluorescens]
MQLAILLALILIAVILAPWLLGVIAVLVAAYGLWLAVAFALTIAAIAIGAVVLLISRRGLVKKRDISSGAEQKIAEANRLYRAKEAARRAVAAQEELKYIETPERDKKASTATCKSCSASIEKHSMYCPKCGKSPI